MLIAAGQSMLTGRGATAKDYIQDGLIAMWDGIENAGWGVHDSSATTWKDLIGNCTLSTNGSFQTDKLILEASSNTLTTATGSLIPEDIRTVEFCFLFRTGSGHFFVDDQQPSGNFPAWEVFLYSNRLDGGIMLRRLGTPMPAGQTGTYYTHYESIATSQKPDVAKPHTFALRTGQPSSTNTGIYVDGTMKGYSSYTQSHPTSYTGKFRAYGGLDIYSIRMYGRVISQEEIAANHAIDKERFGLP